MRLFNDWKKIKDAYASYLDQMRWTHFGTFTSDKILSRNAGRRLAYEIAKQITTRMLPDMLKMVWVIEAFQARDGYHLHALLYCPREADVTALRQWYKNSYGVCKIMPKRGRASKYLVKHIHREQNDYGFI